MVNVVIELGGRYAHAKSLQSYPILWDPNGLWPTRLLCPWDSPGKNTGMHCQTLLQGIFPNQGLTHVSMFPALAGRFFTAGATGEAQQLHRQARKILPTLLMFENVL